MISSLETNLAMRRAFTNLYQKRETKAETYEGETVKSQVSSLTKRRQRKVARTKRKRNPSLAERLLQKLVIDTIGTRQFWQRFATLPQPSGWDCNHMIYLIHIHVYRALLFNAMNVLGNCLFCDAGVLKQTTVFFWSQVPTRPIAAFLFTSRRIPSC
ncbi:hypothetical protein EV421DRAFT_164958 [Armillaria borealis]|uniref:Uncharacterized protein n=1 Tax=Armillaria borealis TaxID=47425 RepID=A0AA39IW55_9AGAR|nr:hypothetical protein EV421DRAFT_164958 [Armillaria borealis]